jgi:hypothetical protein
VHDVTAFPFARKPIARQRELNKKDFLLDNLRIRDLSKLARYWYADGNGDYLLPDTAQGRVLAIAIITHQCFKPPAWLFRFCRERAPWLDPNEVDRKHLYPKKADALGHELRLSATVRDKLRIRTIGSCDQSRDKRAALVKARKRERDRERQRQKRLLAGKQLRAAYLAAHSQSRVRPWEADGVSRRTWYRRRGTSPSSHKAKPTFMERHTCAAGGALPIAPATRLSPGGARAYAQLVHLLHFDHVSSTAAHSPTPS